jgi:hypothetical protein
MFTTTTTRFATSISAVAHRTEQNGRRSLVVTNVTKVNERSSFQFFSVVRYFFLTSFTSIEKRGSAPLYYSYTLTLKHSALFSSRLLTFFACSPHILLILDEYNIR